MRSAIVPKRGPLPRWVVATLVSAILAVPALTFSGCGYAGEPKPPALRRPLKATGLTAVERGAKISVTFTLPDETTEGLFIDEPADVELRIGPAPAPWDVNKWVGNSDRIPVPELIPPPRRKGELSAVDARKAAKRSKRPPRAARGSSGAGGASGSAAKNKTLSPPKIAKATAPAPPLPDKSLFLRNVNIDAAKYSGKTVAVGVRVHGPEGRDDGWSIVQLEVFPVLPVPHDVHASDAPNAVHLQWTAAAPAFQIFRRQLGNPDWVRIGESTQPSYDDTTIEYGKTWQYYVQSVRKTNGGQMVSDPSEIYTFKPTDRFPPAAPTGLVAIAGVRTVELTWDRGTDPDLAGYRVYRNGQRIADGLVTPSFSDQGVATGGRYSYQVTAVDGAGNESPKSSTQEVVME